MPTNRHHGLPARDSATAVPEAMPRRGALWFGLALVIASAAFATYARLGELSAWRDHPALYVASGVPMMTTLDAYYSLRLARLYARGEFVAHGPAPARHYARPELDDPRILYEQREPWRLPLLSGIIAVLSPLFGGDIDRTALLLPPVLSSLFAIPLFLCCWRLGVPAAGVIGALVGTFAIDYYQRTSVGWVDTDALNLFFPWSASCLILALRAGQQARTQLLLSAAVGVVLYLFFLWYAKPGLTLLFAIALAAHLHLAHASWRRTMLCVLALVVCADVFQFKDALINVEDFGRRYLWPAGTQLQGASSAVRFADVWSTIGEARHLSVAVVLARILGRADLGAIGLAGFAAFAVSRWRSMAALAPVVMLGALALVSSERFVFYLAPLAGIGWGFIVSTLTAYAVEWTESRSARWASSDDARAHRRPLSRMRFALLHARPQAEVACVVVVIVFVVGFAPLAASRHFIPAPAIPALVFRDLQRLGRELPARSRLWTWWDYGFAIVDATGFGVYHDGSAQYTPQTNLIAASFVAADQSTMLDVIRFVDREGNRGIRRLAGSAYDFDDLLARMPAVDRFPGDAPIYVLYTPDMLLKYGAMRTLGSAHAPQDLVHGSAGIRLLRCVRIVSEALECGSQSIDLRTGAIESYAGSSESRGVARLRRAIVVEVRGPVREREYSVDSGSTVEIVMQDSTVRAVYLLDEPAFLSNLNQMFVLGRYDLTRFEETYDDFPYARAFRVLTPQ